MDGTSENGSKWCATNKQSGWMTIKLDQPRTIKRIRIEHAQYGGEAQNMNTIAFSVQYKSGNNWVTAYSTNNNSSAVTDELITPVTAQEWRLYINNSGSSAWGAIRIYEWQMFETTERNRTDIVLMKFASAKNNKGASDTFSLTHAPTGSTVRLYLRDANGNYTQIASKEAQSSTVSFTGLDYGSDAGRVFYTVQEGKQEESIKLSTAFDAEPGAVKYSINVVQPANGSVAASATSATAGTTVKLTATPAEGYTLDYFTLDGARINGNTFIMPARNVEVSAVFTANAYSITVVQPTGGTVSASATSATAGTTVKLTATPAEGYTLDYFTLDGARINGDTFIMPARNVEVSAVFTANAYSINVVQPANGMVSASATSATAGTTVKLTANPAEGYTLDYFTLDGERINGNTFIMPARNVEVSAVFTTNAYSITVVQPANGTVSASATSAAAGTTIELTATPAEGYTLDYFTLDGARINGNTFIMPARNVEVSAVFTANAYSITVVQPAGGTVSASKLSAFFGEAVELTAVPDEGYELSHYVVNGAANNGSSFTMPAHDVMVTAVFTKVAEPSVNLALNATIYYFNKKYPDYAKNGPQHAFDGKMSDREADKWHASGVNGWVAFDIHTPVANPILKIYHAGSAGEGSDLNTSSWDVYILNERYLTEEAYFNMDRSTQNRVCQIAWFWKRIHVTTGNTADISVDHIDMPEARRLFKINMRKTNQTGYPYHLNVYEIEMYAGN
ncbi:MAG: InlB B-repeat-containing protein [Christensenellales bacterium]